MLQQHGTHAQASLFRPAGVTDNVPKVTDGPLLPGRAAGKKMSSPQGFQVGASRVRGDGGSSEGGLIATATDGNRPVKGGVAEQPGLTVQHLQPMPGLREGKSFPGTVRLLRGAPVGERGAQGAEPRVILPRLGLEEGLQHAAAGARGVLVAGQGRARESILVHQSEQDGIAKRLAVVRQRPPGLAKEHVEGVAQAETVGKGKARSVTTAGGRLPQGIHAGRRHGPLLRQQAGGAGGQTAQGHAGTDAGQQARHTLPRTGGEPQEGGTQEGQLAVGGKSVHVRRE